MKRSLQRAMIVLGSATAGLVLGVQVGAAPIFGEGLAQSFRLTNSSTGPAGARGFNATLSSFFLNLDVLSPSTEFAVEFFLGAFDEGDLAPPEDLDDPRVLFRTTRSLSALPAAPLNTDSTPLPLKKLPAATIPLPIHGPLVVFSNQTLFLGAQLLCLLNSDRCSERPVLRWFGNDNVLQPAGNFDLGIAYSRNSPWEPQPGVDLGFGVLDTGGTLVAGFNPGAPGFSATLTPSGVIPAPATLGLLLAGLLAVGSLVARRTR